MGIVGRYIDSLPSDAKDRIIEAQAWIDKNSNSFVLPDGSRCLVGHAEDWYLSGLLNQCRRYFHGYSKLPLLSLAKEPYNRYVYLVRRFGLSRMVRLFKMRAAKGEPKCGHIEELCNLQLQEQ